MSGMKRLNKEVERLGFKSGVLKIENIRLYMFRSYFKAFSLLTTGYILQDEEEDGPSREGDCHTPRSFTTGQSRQRFVSR